VIRTIVIIDPHNWSGIGNKISKALRLIYDRVWHIRPKHVSLDKVRKAYAHVDMILYIEPGDFPLKKIHEKVDDDLYPVLKGIQRPNVKLGILWCGSICRVDNVVMAGHITAQRGEFFKERRRILNSLVSVRMVATECLMNTGRVKWLGQPYDFPSELPDKPLEHKIIHTPTNPINTDIYKGTNKIQKAFNEIDNTEIIKYGTDNNIVLNKLEQSTIYVMTMTDFDSGLGYGGIEAISRGCLVLSKKPKSIIQTPIIDVRDEEDLIRTIEEYKEDREKYDRDRALQFNWARKKLSYRAVGRRFKQIVNKS